MAYPLGVEGDYHPNDLKCVDCGKHGFECECVDACEKCGSEDIRYETYPGMAGWASPVSVRTCGACNATETEETILYDESGDIA